ncbi:MAG: UDP-N-acetylglucosamine 1-carboxyvinyltransferase [Bacteroidales bacterium]|nr:UDP-N-acetylglucosamine 1-carboxyvinyltransferase [Anaerotignum sp.]MCI5680123.1 UDP-N-acetylglucosamine 1-carboxyvinyltransferase [Bacteroidales bacterium]MDY3927174.1 UDP-N-acetylglucosamine 1-carboxyvinyltransferase [Anaerotignum sp.]
MGTYIVRGGRKIEGEFAVRGSKNTALPILAASLLAEDEVVLENIPLIRDVFQTLDILRELGCKVSLSEETRTVTIDSRHLSGTEIGNETVRKMRSSILFLGALLGREKRGKLAYPGGCAIGKRPIDLHLSAFEKMGVTIREKGVVLDCRAERILGQHIYLDFPSVGATENILLLASKAEGVTVIHNAAREPEIVSLVRFLRAIGAEIYGEGTASIMVEGVKDLHGAYYVIPADRIEGGTFLCAAAMTGGELRLKGLEREQMGAVLEVMQMTGCRFLWEDSDLLWMRPPKQLLSDFTIVTGPFPAFPTDMQPLMMSLLTLAKGNCMISETVFEARFSQGEELCRMGADIRISGRNASIYGVEKLHGAEVFARDLRCGASLLVAALAAEGESRVHGSEYVERGYEKIEDAFSFLGGDIRLT